MRGLNAFQMAQMRHRDARVFLLFQHLRAAIDVLEQIASEPFQPPARQTSASIDAKPAAPAEVPPEKLAYTIKEAVAVLGIGKSTLYEALAQGELAAVKRGSRTLIPADNLRQWIAQFPRARR